MLSLYLFSLIVGGGLLLVSVLGVFDGDDAPESDSWHGVAPGEAAVAQEFLSVRSLFYFLAGFGGTGTLLTAVGAGSAALVTLFALVTGLTAAGLAAMVYGWLRRSESGLVSADPDYLVGLPARVVVAMDGDRRGKVIAVHAGREVELLARPFSRDDPACPRGSEVVIVEIRGDTAFVAPLPALPSVSLEDREWNT